MTVALCEHVFVQGKGSPHAHFQRAIERRHLTSAEAAARDLPRLSLADALALCVLMGDQDPEKFQRAGARWHARFVLEARAIGLLDSQLALAAVAALPNGNKEAIRVVCALAKHYRMPNLDRALRAR
jgi:hypothetical protein